MRDPFPKQTTRSTRNIPIPIPTLRASIVQHRGDLLLLLLLGSGYSRRRDHFGVYPEKSEHASKPDECGEHEAWFGAVDEVPEDGVDEGEGEGDLEG